MRRLAPAAVGSLVLGALCGARPPAPRPGEPTPQDAVNAVNAVSAWLAQGRVPDTTDHDTWNSAGACVELRLPGGVVVRSISVEHPSALRTAAAQAWAQVRARLDRDSGVGAADLLSRAAREIAVGVELAGPLVPIAPGTYDDLETSLSPGVDGVAVRIGDRLEAVFPGTMLRYGTAPSFALAGAVSRAAGDPLVGIRTDPAGQPSAVAASRGARFYSFRTQHAVQPDAGEPALPLFRGSRLTDVASLDSAGIASWAGSMADYLGRRTRDDGTVRATLAPTTGRELGEHAEPVASAVVAYALARYASAPGTTTDRAERSRAAASRIVHALAGTPANSLGLIGAAIASAAASSLGLDLSDPEFSKWPAALFGAAQLPDRLSEPERGALAFGLASIGGSDPNARAAARAVLDALYLATEPGGLVAHTPWAVWAELAVTPDGPIGASEALRDLRDRARARQITGARAQPDEIDLVGGVVLTGGARAIPNFHTARVAGATGAMLGNPALTGQAERSPAILFQLGMLQFLRQLTADRANGWMYADPLAPEGGVRSSVWDQRQPPEATALALLAACETLKGLERLSAE